MDLACAKASPLSRSVTAVKPGGRSRGEAVGMGRGGSGCVGVTARSGLAPTVKLPRATVGEELLPMGRHCERSEAIHLWTSANDNTASDASAQRESSFVES